MLENIINDNASLLLYIVLFAPFAGMILGGIFGGSKKSILIGYANSLFILCSLLASCALVFTLNVPFKVVLFDWIALGDFKTQFSFGLDSINGVMIIVISLVSFLVHLYSIGYMKEDRGFNRYFSFLSGFVFSMMFLVLSDNFLGLFVGWEGVGVCSYLLIGFWYEKASANFASIEAFISNRIADLGMLLGIFLIYWSYGSLQYDVVFDAIKENPLDSVVLWIGVLLFIGAMGKSAQFPLHTWLADAMEGPTPVSALIHAATMVTAGVYLVIRAHPIYEQIPHFGECIAYLGAFVALFAASMALVNRDLKRIIAYSTLSQLGYMFVAAGLGAYWVALFHLFTHAFFKSLLFLGAGNVMHAMHDELDIKKMGALAKPLKFTMLFMLIGSVALCGIPPFAGYFSKDLIIEFSINNNYRILWLALVAGACMTAFYSFRLLMLVFFAPKAHNIANPHEGSAIMLLAMLPLAVLAVIAGFCHSDFESFVNIKTQIEHTPLVFVIISFVFIFGGIFFAIWRYRKLESNAESKGLVFVLLFNQYYIPKIYELIFVRGFGALCRFLWLKIELKLIDSMVDSIGRILLALSKSLKPMQNGNLSSYLRLMLFSLLVVIASGLVFIGIDIHTLLEILPR